MAEALTDVINGMDRIIVFLRNSKDPKHNVHEYQRATTPQSEVFETDLANAYKLIYGQLPSDGKRPPPSRIRTNSLHQISQSILWFSG
jgi:hypothetical protein